MPDSATAAALQQAAEGLSYVSESDAPWTAFHWPAAKGAPTAAEVRKQAKVKAKGPAEEQSVDDFFAPLVKEEDWFGDAEKADAARYRALLAAVKQCLRNPKVVKLGSRKRAVFVVGEAAEGGWAGLQTTAVET